MTATTKKKMSAKSKAMWKRIKELQAEGYTLKEARAIYAGKPFPIETAVVPTASLPQPQVLSAAEIIHRGLDLAMQLLEVAGGQGVAEELIDSAVKIKNRLDDQRHEQEYE